MKQLHRVALLTVLSLGAGLASAFAFALPGPTACLLIGAMELHRLPDGSLTDSTIEQDQDHFVQLARQARERISLKFGPVQAQPVLVFFTDPNGVGPFPLNSHGSAQFVGGRACVMVGPKGHTVDVVAHELMHTEIHHRVGYMKRWLQLPVWFDEGIAMQVDHRPRYAMLEEDLPNAEAVRELVTVSAFFNGGEKTVVANCARAKHVAASWLAKVGDSALYPRLDRMKRGESFEEAMAE